MKNPLVYSNPEHSVDAVQLKPHSVCDDAYPSERRVTPLNFRPSFFGTIDPCIISAKSAKNRAYPSSNGIVVTVVVGLVVAFAVVVATLLVVVEAAASVTVDVVITLSPAVSPV